MADSFFGFDTSISNINDDEGGGGPSEDEYDALNDETFGADDDTFDWEVEHEHLAGQLESNRRHNSSQQDDAANEHLEASLSQLVFDDSDTVLTNRGNIWGNHSPAAVPVAHSHHASLLKNVCTVEELERQLRQPRQHQPLNQSVNQFFQPRFPVVLQRPPGPMAYPSQQMQTNQPVSKMLGPGHVMNSNQLSQQNVNQFVQKANQMVQQNANNPFAQNQTLIQNHLSQASNHLMSQQNQMGQTMNQMSQNLNQMPQNLNQMPQNLSQMPQSLNQMPQNMGQMPQSLNQMSQNLNQMSQNLNQAPQTMNQMGQNVSQIPQNLNQMSQNLNQMSQNPNQVPQTMNQMGQNVNQMSQNLNQMGQNSQMMPNGNFGPNIVNQMQSHMIGQSRMIAPPPGMTMPRQNFSPNMGQYNPNFRGPAPMPSKPNIDLPPMSQQNVLINQQSPQNQSINQTQSQLNQSINQTQSQLNQKSSQVNQTQKQTAKPQTRTEKPQTSKTSERRNLVFNNSKTMTSQNLVQLIQTTHPMLQFNNSFHNANHHPMLNRSIFGNPYQGNALFGNQRNNGSFSNNRLLMNGDDSCLNGFGKSETDEYAGLMSQREKQWLLNIQMLQLNTGTPYIDDFYYTVFLERQSKQKDAVKEAHKANQQNHPFYSSGVKQECISGPRERHNSGRHNSGSDDAPTPRTYVPTQFENSLGKLQCGSVTAPRKIIDVDLVPNEASNPGQGRQSRAASVASTSNPLEAPREMRRTKQLLLDIEALYMVLLRLEEINDPLAISNALILKEREEKQRQLELAQQEALGDDSLEDESNLFLRNIESVQKKLKTDSPKAESIDKRQVVSLSVGCSNPNPVVTRNLLDENKDELMGRMFSGLLCEDRLQQFLMVRKGKMLLARMCARVPETHPRLRTLWARVFRSLPAAARRDDGTLANLSLPFRRYIQSTSGWAPVAEVCAIIAEALDPARTPHALTSSFTMTSICALVDKASTLITTPEPTAQERQWTKFLKTLARALKNTSLKVAKTTAPLQKNKLYYQLKLLESRTPVEILQRGRTTVEFGDVTKSDVTEQLTEHLC